jgi:hypothetical protein
VKDRKKIKGKRRRIFTVTIVIFFTVSEIFLLFIPLSAAKIYVFEQKERKVEFRLSPDLQDTEP